MQIPNDGKQILLSLRAAHPRERSASKDPYYVRLVYSLLQSGKVDTARQTIERGNADGCNSPQFRFAALTALGNNGEWTAVQRLAAEQLATTADARSRAALASWLCVAHIYAGNPADLDDALRLSDEMMQIEPWEDAVMSARAVVLLAAGRDADAEPLLRDSHPANWSARAALAHAWVDFYTRRGDDRRRAHWLRRAGALDPRNAFRIPSPASSTQFAAARAPVPVDA
jgi:hypothetical protein